MPYVVDDADFSKFMVELEVSNKISDNILKHVEVMNYSFYFIVIAEVITLGLLFFEWRYPHLVKKWFSPPETEKTSPLVSNAV